MDDSPQTRIGTKPSPTLSRPRRRQLALGTLILVVAGGLALVIHQYANDPARAYARAYAAWRRGDVAGVRQELPHLQGQPRFAAHRHFLQGALLSREGKLPEALHELEHGVRHPDLEIDALVLTGQVQYQMGRAGNAQRTWEQALKVNPQAVDAHRWLGVLYYDIGAMENALVHLQEVSKLDPQDHRPDRLLGLINKDYERPDVAVKHYQESLRRSPQQPDREAVLEELAQAQMKLFDYQGALETLKQCRPSSDRTILESECRLSVGDKDQASALLEALPDLADHKEGLLLKGRIQMERGDLAGAVLTLKTAAEKNPKDFVVRFKLVQALRRDGQTEAAAEHEQVAEELKELWRRFSDLHMEAMKSPTNAAIRSEIGSLALQLERPDLAKSWFQAVLAIDPNNQQAIKQLQQLP